MGTHIFNSPYDQYDRLNGQEFSIIKEDVVTTQGGLWCGGDVPPEYRDVLKDNASFATTSARPRP